MYLESIGVVVALAIIIFLIIKLVKHEKKSNTKSFMRANPINNGCWADEGTSAYCAQNSDPDKCEQCADDPVWVPKGCCPGSVQPGPHFGMMWQ
jgi:hypothetical protein